MSLIVTFFEILSCFLIFNRLSDELIARKFIHQKVKYHLLFSFFVWLIVISYGFSFSRLLFSLSLWPTVILLTLTPFFLNRIRKKQFEEVLPLVINQTIIKMRIGNSFRSALKEAIATVQAPLSAKFEKIYDSLGLELSKQRELLFSNDRDVRRLFEVFKAIDGETHNQLQRILHFREMLLCERHFKSRVSRALSQVKAQATVLTFIYAGLLTLVIYRFGWRSNSQIIFISLLLFAIGQVLILKVGGHFRWKV